jgi:hypothetical protein
VLIARALGHPIGAPAIAFAEPPPMASPQESEATCVAS